MADGFAGLRCSEERHRSMGGVWGCVAMTVVLLAEARICGCIVHVDTFSDRSDEGAQRIGTDQRDKLIGVTSCDLSDRADLSTGWTCAFHVKRARPLSLGKLISGRCLQYWPMSFHAGCLLCRNS